MSEEKRKEAPTWDEVVEKVEELGERLENLERYLDLPGSDEERE